MASPIEATLRHVLYLAYQLHNCEPRCVVVAALLELGIPTKLAGFDLLKYAIEIYYDHPELITVKEVFHEVRRRYAPEISLDQIDQAIRTAITEAWGFRDDAVWQCYFPQVMSQGMKKPTNAEFITQLAKLLELWDGCGKAVAHYGYSLRQNETYIEDTL